MVLNSESKNTIKFTHCLSYIDESIINEVLKGLFFRVILGYMREEEIAIPYIGKFIIKYKGDEIANKGRRAILDIEFTPDSNLEREIGLIEDKNFDESSIKKYLLDDIRNSLASIAYEKK